MTVVAVAGGTGDVGKTIVDQLLLSGRHKVIVLSRKAIDLLAKDGLEYLVVNYDVVEATARALEASNVDTIISALSLEGSAEEAQLNLIKAAEKSATTRRFMPSGYAGYVSADDIVTDEMRAPLVRSAKALAQSGLEYTRVASGVFMDYFGHPRIPSHLRSFQWAINVPSRCAALPGSGDETISLTYSKDVARFIERLLDTEDWPEHSIICGSDSNLNEIVAIAGKTIGERFRVSYDSIDDLKQGKATVIFADGSSFGGLDAAATAAFMGLSVVDGQMALPKEGRLNDRFPDIRPLTIQELIGIAWS